MPRADGARARRRAADDQHRQREHRPADRARHDRRRMSSARRARGARLRRRLDLRAVPAHGGAVGRRVARRRQRPERPQHPVDRLVRVGGVEESPWEDSRRRAALREAATEREEAVATEEDLGELHVPAGVRTEDRPGRERLGRVEAEFAS